MKIHTNIAAILLTGTLFFSSCIKDNNSGTEINGLQPMAVIPEGGLANFSSVALNFPPTDPSDTAFFHANYAWNNVAPNDVTFTLAYDANALAVYNGGSTIKYTKFPDSIYSFKAGTVTVKAGQSYSSAIPLTLYPGKIDPTKNYMFPISITDAQGTTISGNFGTIYYHLIGNPIAGTYNVSGTRYNYLGSISYSGGPIPGTFVSTNASPSPKMASAIDPTTISLDYANLGGNGFQYIISFDPVTQTITNVSGNFLSSVSNFGVITKTYDPILKQMHIVTTYNNGAAGSGNDRIIDETFTHQ